MIFGELISKNPTGINGLLFTAERTTKSHLFTADKNTIELGQFKLGRFSGRPLTTVHIVTQTLT